MGALCALAVLLPVTGRSQVVINELMADNSSAYTYEGQNPDWIELYNTSTSPIDIGDMSLSRSTNSADIRQFVFPTPTVIPGRGFLIVHCDSSTNFPGPALNTRFSLGKKGGLVKLYDKLINGAYLKDQVIYGLQVTDFSIGRSPNGTGSWVLNTPTPEAANLAKTLGPMGSLRINEWAATNTPSSTNSPGKDWLEVYNTSTNPVSLGGLVFTSELPPTIPYYNRPITNLSFIGPRGYLQFMCLGNDAKANDELDFKLSHNTGETNTLYAPDRVTPIDRISFRGINEIPGYWIPDISYGRLPDGTTNWPVRFGTGGIGKPTPGDSNFAPITNAIINEVLTHTDRPLEDAIELYNPTAEDVNIGGWYLSNSPDDAKKFKIPTGTILPAYGFKVFYECVGCAPGAGFNWNGLDADRTFTLNSARGDQVYLFTADATGKLTGYRTGIDFGPAPNGMSYGRYIKSDGTKDIVLQSRHSFGTDVAVDDPPTDIFVFRTGQGRTNVYPEIGPLIINEVMYHPPDVLQGGYDTNNVWITNRIDDSTNEFIEIYNMSSAQVPLFDAATPYPTATNGLYYAPGYPPWDTIPYADGKTNTWRVRGDVDFDFPPNTYLGPGKYLLLVNFNPTNTPVLEAFRAKWGIPDSFNNNKIFGPYGGKLDNKKGTIDLRRPDWPQGPRNPADFTNRLVPYYTVDQVTYDDDPPWPTNVDGGGLSLQRLRPEQYANDFTNWTESVPTPGRLNQFDQDRDGMPDDWEQAHGLDPGDPNDAGLDPDQDGMTNLQEYLAGTDPQDSGSVLKIVQPRLVEAGQIQFQFTAESNKTYRVECTEGLGTGVWSNLLSYGAAPTNRVIKVADPAAAGPPGRVYRVRTP